MPGRAALAVTSCLSHGHGFQGRKSHVELRQSMIRRALGLETGKGWISQRGLHAPLACWLRYGGGTWFGPEKVLYARTVHTPATNPTPHRFKIKTYRPLFCDHTGFIRDKVKLSFKEKMNRPTNHRRTFSPLKQEHLVNTEPQLLAQHPHTRYKLQQKNKIK